MVRLKLFGSNWRTVATWYWSGRRKAVWPWQDNVCGPVASDRVPPHEAVYPVWSFLMITKAFPDWRFPAMLLRLICVAATSHSGVLDWAVQPLASCPTGPGRYAGVILTGASRDPLTSRGFVDRQLVVPVLWSVVQLRGTPEAFPVVFPAAEKVMLAFRTSVIAQPDWWHLGNGLHLRLVRSCVAARPRLVEQKPGCRAVRLERGRKRLARAALVPSRAGMPCRGRRRTARRTPQLHGHVGGPVERVKVSNRQVRRCFQNKLVDQPAGGREGARRASRRQLLCEDKDVADCRCKNSSQSCRGQESCHCWSALVATAENKHRQAQTQDGEN